MSQMPAYSVVANKMKAVPQAALMEHGSGGLGGLIRLFEPLDCCNRATIGLTEV
jgi:hypothetical protein